MPPTEADLECVAPEVFHHRRYSVQSDLFAAGVILRKICFGIEIHNFPERKTAETFAALIKACLNPDFNARPSSANELLACLASFAPAPSPSAPPPPAPAQARGTGIPVPVKAVQKTLADLLVDEPGERRRLIQMLVDTLDQLADYQQKGIRHGILAPWNLVVTPDGNSVQVPPADEQENSGELGSPKYVAPDLLSGSTERDATADSAVVDIYTVGFIFYELLLGRTAFQAQFAQCQGDDGLAWFGWHTDASAKAKPLAELVQGFPISVSLVVESMIDKNPRQRVQQFLSAVGKLRSAAEQTLAPGPATSQQMRARVPSDAGRKKSGAFEVPAAPSQPKDPAVDPLLARLSALPQHGSEDTIMVTLAETPVETKPGKGKAGTSSSWVVAPPAAIKTPGPMAIPIRQAQQASPPSSVSAAKPKIAIIVLILLAGLAAAGWYIYQSGLFQEFWPSFLRPPAKSSKVFEPAKLEFGFGGRSESHDR